MQANSSENILGLECYRQKNFSADTARQLELLRRGLSQQFWCISKTFFLSQAKCPFSRGYSVLELKDSWGVDQVLRDLGSNPSPAPS